MLEKEYWKKKKLKEFSKAEWEALCDNCGKCCLFKLEDIDTGEIHYTNVSCKLLCSKTAMCQNYKNRKKLVKDCVKLSYQNIEVLNWMPVTCSYKLIHEGKNLPSWHYLVCGSKKKMKEMKKTVANRIINETNISKKSLPNYIFKWD